MGYLLILLFTALNICESSVVKLYSKRHNSGGMLMNAIISLFGASFFLVSDFIDADTRGLYFPLEMIPLAILNSVLFAAGFYFAFLAFKIGPFGLTRLFSSFSLMLPIFYGIFFLDDETTPITYVGIAMILCAMVLINVESKEKKQKRQEGSVSFKWLVYSLIMLFSNGFISILLKKVKLDWTAPACANEFQMLSMLGAFVILFVLGLIVDRKNIGYIFKNGTLYGILAGIINGSKNYLMILLHDIFIYISMLSPIKTGFSMVASFLMSVLFYKEKYSVVQIIGVVLGASAVILFAF